MSFIADTISVEVITGEGRATLTCVSEGEVADRVREAFEIYNSPDNQYLMSIFEKKANYAIVEAECRLYSIIDSLQEEVERLKMLVHEDSDVIDLDGSQPPRKDVLKDLPDAMKARKAVSSRQRPRNMHMMC
jgi:hypothetical protein